MSAVDNYLALLRHSGYFSARYLAGLRAQALTVKRTLEHKQPNKNTSAFIEDFPLFPLNYDDMLSQKDTFVFTAEKEGKVVLLEDEYGTMKFTFNNENKIDAYSNKSKASDALVQTE